MMSVRSYLTVLAVLFFLMGGAVASYVPFNNGGTLSKGVFKGNDNDIVGVSLSASLSMEGSSRGYDCVFVVGGVLCEYAINNVVEASKADAGMSVAVPVAKRAHWF